MKRLTAGALASLALTLSGCPKDAPVREIGHFAADSLEGVIGTSDVQVDTAVKAEGAASLRVDAKGPVTVRLYEVRDPGVENARLLYQARLRTKDLKGQAYLEMWCRFPGLGEYFSRALQAPVSGTTVWTIQETPFFLQKGQKPDLVKLNLVVEGAGTVWIDDVRLTQGPPR